ncbi:YdcH family protein [Rhodoligotrophos defluvii]|uniref:YdcH family protein n=1 Tax=Rhodoligotrophos defluvii TaxID=2561934 RepID=UPI0010C97365|nr:YdcH family protein [Rhodoligotrophos defluvii]
MSLRSHLEELVNKHRTLDSKIHAAEACPSMDGLKVLELKKEKLRLKDEISRIQAQLAQPH